MSKRIGRLFVICEEPEERCPRCGDVDELRPYGPGGQRLCFDCSSLFPEIRRVRCEALMDGRDPDQAERALKLRTGNEYELSN